ncbi:hypothetical protein BDN70DRAFT_885949 [Pholiota conissans]|uniref:Uncharacterized protein n=1 Tax=Pholiota conissans TaxID=109636 RepID=A0A9P5YQM7_9AGAR|nr:hypothetical protein BDN70DRAFT_885949 [Pholiota conissans]
MHMPLPSPGHVYSAYPVFPSPPAFGVHPAFITSSGLPSPHGLYPVYQTPQQSHTQQQQQHQQHQAHQLRLNLASVHGPFSPGVVMSPGTFYGRPGEVVPNPNPWINAAVGAPVHVGEHPPAQSPHHGQGPTPHAYATHGSYFYAMSSPKKAPSGHEPKGYFDPMYFPASASGYGGYVAATAGAGAGDSSGLAKEVGVQAKEGGDGGGGVEARGETGEGGGSEKGKGKEVERDEKPSALAHAVSESGADDVFALADASAEAELGGATISRTHSVGYARKPGAGHTASSGQVVSDSPPPSFAKSDPIQGWSRSVANAVASTEIDDIPLRAPASIQELKLPARVPWRSAAPYVAAKEKETKKEGESD